MGNDCVKTSDGLQMDDDHLRYNSENSRNTLKYLKTEKQRMQYYLNMNSDAAEKSIANKS